MSKKKQNCKKYLENGYKALENDSYFNTLRAINLFNKAEKRLSSNDPKNLLIKIGKNTANIKRHKINDCKNDYLKYINSNPNNISLILAYAQFCENISNINEAKLMYSKSLIFSKSPLIYLNILRNDETIKDLDFLKEIKMDKLNKEDKVYVYYILAKLYERNENYKKSWINYYKYNMSRYNLPISKLMLDTYRKSFKNIRDLVNLPNFPKKQIDNDVPLVFIVGFHKSGINLVNKIINEHKNIYSMDNISPDFTKVKLDDDDNKEQKLTLGIGKKEEKPVRDDTEMYYKLFDELYYDMKNIYNDSDIKSSNTIKYFSIACSEMYMYLGVISSIFKNVKIISCERNFNDMGISVYKGHYQNKNMNWSSDLSEIVNYYKFYKDNMDFWKIPSNIIKKIKYEDLVNNFDKITNEIQEFLQLEKQDLSFFNQSRIKTTTEDNISINKKIYNTSIDKWKNYEKYISELITYDGV